MRTTVATDTPKTLTTALSRGRRQAVLPSTSGASPASNSDESGNRCACVTPVRQIGFKKIGRLRSPRVSPTQKRCCWTPVLIHSNQTVPKTRYGDEANSICAIDRRPQQVVYRFDYLSDNRVGIEHA